MKYSYLIVDDEPLARKLIASHAAKIDGLECVAQCANALEAANLLQSKKVDLIFLDIQMPEVNGLQLASSLHDRPSIILTTAFRDFAPEAFDLEVVDYLLKPVSFDRFLKAVNRFFDQATSSQPRMQDGMPSFLYLRSDRKEHKVFIHEITIVESLDDYVKVHRKDNVLITRENISSLENKLPPGTFVRIHRSFIINTAFVKTITGEGVSVNGRELPFGRAFKKAALKLLQATRPPS